MTEPRTEAQLTARIVKAIRATYPDAWVMKVHATGYQRNGIPDLLICHAGRLYGLEVKHQKPGESLARMLRRVRPDQQKELDGIAGAGGVGTVVWSVDQALEVLRHGARESEGKDD